VTVIEYIKWKQDFRRFSNCARKECANCTKEVVIACSKVMEVIVQERLKIEAEKLLFKIESDGFDYAVSEYGHKLGDVNQEFSEIMDQYMTAKELIEKFLEKYKEEEI